MANTSLRPSENDKAAILIFARDTLQDLYTVRDAEISNVMNLEGGKWVCAKMIARNRFGPYTGRKYVSFRLEAGGVSKYSLMGRVESATSSGRRFEAACETISKKGLVYQPFPELDNIIRGWTRRACPSGSATVGKRWRWQNRNGEIERRLGKQDPLHCGLIRDITRHNARPQAGGFRAINPGSFLFVRGLALSPVWHTAGTSGGGAWW